MPTSLGLPRGPGVPLGAFVLASLLAASGCQESTSTDAIASGGAAASGGGTASGGTAVGGGPGSGGLASSGGASSGGASAGGASSGGLSGDSGGSASGGDGSGSGGGAVGGSGGGGGDECTRELLDGTLAAYFDALEAHDPTGLPLSASVKFTENAEEMEIGSAGLWTTAGALEHFQSAADVDLCTVAAQAVIPDGATDIPIAVRIKLVSGEITEIETIVARIGDYAAEDNNPAAIIAAAAGIGWDVPVPAGQQDAREDIIAWMDKYFRFFPQGVCSVTGDCIRLENGGGNYDCDGFGAICMQGDPGPTDMNLPPRLILADVEMGVGVGFTIYTGHTDMHMFKMVGGQVSAVHIVLSHTDGQSGWE